MPRQLLESLQARLSACADGDPGPVLAQESLTEAAALWEAVRSGSHPVLAGEAVYVLACLHWTRYHALPEGQDAPDFRSAVQLFGLLDPEHPEFVPNGLWPLLDAANTSTKADSPRILGAHGSELLQRAVASNNTELFDRAIDALHRAMSATAPSHSDRNTMLSNLRAALRIRFERAGQQADLDAAIDAGQQAVATTPADHPNRAGRLSNLGTALRTRFAHTGQQADLDAAINAGQQAAPPADHPNRAKMLANLGSALKARFQRTGNPTDLDEAVAVSGAAAMMTTAPTRVRIIGARRWARAAGGLIPAPRWRGTGLRWGCFRSWRRVGWAGSTVNTCWMSGPG